MRQPNRPITDPLGPFPHNIIRGSQPRVLHAAVILPPLLYIGACEKRKNAFYAYGIYNTQENPIPGNDFPRFWTLSTRIYPLLILDRGNNIWRKRRGDLVRVSSILPGEETVGYSRTYIFDGVIIIREAPLIRSSFPPDRLLTFDPSDEVWGK